MILTDIILFCAAEIKLQAGDCQRTADIIRKLKGEKMK